MVISNSSSIRASMIGNSTCICENTCKDHTWTAVSALINMNHLCPSQSFFSHAKSWKVITLQARMSPVSHTPWFFLTPPDKRATQSAASARARGNAGVLGSEADASKMLRSEWKIWGLGPQTAASTGERPFGARVEGWIEACSPESYFVPISVEDGWNIKCFHLWPTVLIWSHLKHSWTLWVPFRDSARAI